MLVGGDLGTIDAGWWRNRNIRCWLVENWGQYVLVGGELGTIDAGWWRTGDNRCW